MYVIHYAKLILEKPPLTTQRYCVRDLRQRSTTLPDVVVVVIVVLVLVDVAVVVVAEGVLVVVGCPLVKASHGTGGDECTIPRFFFLLPRRDVWSTPAHGVCSPPLLWVESTRSLSVCLNYMHSFFFFACTRLSPCSAVFRQFRGSRDGKMNTNRQTI